MATPIVTSEKLAPEAKPKRPPPPPPFYPRIHRPDNKATPPKDTQWRAEEARLFDEILGPTDWIKPSKKSMPDAIPHSNIMAPPASEARNETSIPERSPPTPESSDVGSVLDSRAPSTTSSQGGIDLVNAAASIDKSIEDAAQRLHEYRREVAAKLDDATN